jgi:predicted Zn-dependent protease
MRITTSQSFLGAPAIALARKRSIAPHALASFGSAKSANLADAQNNLADLLLESGGKPQEAHALVTEAIAVRGQRASYVDTLARACDAMNDAPCAREAFQKLLDSKGALPQPVRAHAEERLRALGQ